MTSLTQAEHEVLELLSQASNKFCAEVVGSDWTRSFDINEWVTHVHALQHTVMAQAAARAYPLLYRLQGEVLDESV